MISTTDFKRGSTKILLNNEPWLVVESHHVKPGKGVAYVKTKLKNLKTGRLLEETFRSGEKLESPDLDYKTMQYLYSDGEMHHFMDQDDYEQYEFNENQIESVKKYLKESSSYKILFFQNEPISVEPPVFMELTVVETIPGVKGNTAQGGATKPAILETGATIQVPLFINEGEKVKIDTRDNKYIERV